MLLSRSYNRQGWALVGELPVPKSCITQSGEHKIENAEAIRRREPSSVRTWIGATQWKTHIISETFRNQRPNLSKLDKGSDRKPQTRWIHCSIFMQIKHLTCWPLPILVPTSLNKLGVTSSEDLGTIALAEFDVSLAAVTPHAITLSRLNSS